eukprot:2733787-Lingulodinium_polyedra.AAC.1
MRRKLDGSMASGPAEVAEATLRHFAAIEAAEVTDMGPLRLHLAARGDAAPTDLPIACVPTRRQ